jgi:DNA topoisomerase-2
MLIVKKPLLLKPKDDVSLPTSTMTPVTTEGEMIPTQIDSKPKLALKPGIVIKPAVVLKPAINMTQQDTDMQDVYKKLEQKQHILEKPGMYIDSVKSTEEEMFIYDAETKHMVKRKVKFVPGLYKLFDEWIVNMRDQHVRIKEYIELQQLIKEGKAPKNPKVYEDHKYRPVKTMDIKVDLETSTITCRNDGEGVDIFWHEKEKMYIPEMIFGNLLTGTNHDNKQKKKVGGTNGLGAKLINIYSLEFILETVDSYRGLKFTQRFTNNMIREDPVIVKYKGAPYTQLTFKPDLARFGLTSLKDDDTSLLMQKRAYDLAGVTSKDVNVTYNGEKIDIKTFERYVDLYIGGRGEFKRQYEEVNEDWEIVVCASPDDTFEQVSFVNGICTYRGGKHVDHASTIISKRMTKYAQENKKGMKEITEKAIKDNLWIFINCTLVNPEFDSQTKKALTTGVTDFQSKCDISDKLVEKLTDSKMGILEKAIRWSAFKAEKNMSKTDGKKRKRKSAKTIQAYYSGSKQSEQCTLILTEGDSAQSLAVAGLSALSEEKRKYYGIMPLKGKLINPKECKFSKIEKNDEFVELKQELGLKQGGDYSKSLAGLKYGRIMIMTDADVDGDHIKGLIFNLFHEFWPSLLKYANGFFCSLLTPIVKITHNTSGKVLSFYALPDYEKWKQENEASIKQWTAKYYKGLGTSTDEEAREYFKEMKLQKYSWDDLSRMAEKAKKKAEEEEAKAPETTGSEPSEEEDVEQSEIMSETSEEASDIDEDEIDPEDLEKLKSNKLDKASDQTFLELYHNYYQTQGKHPCDLAILLAFSKKHADCRKGWLTEYLQLKARREIDLTLHKLEVMSFFDFINEKLIEFSVYDNERNIPSIMDGLKPGQRKILFGVLKRNLKKEIKVAQLAGYISENTGYHHGEASLNQTIVNLAQDYAGSNNINLLKPNGQFGTRLKNGKDAASPRYIFTCINPLVFQIYNKIDENLLQYMDDDGLLIEPRYYAPILPMILINGSRGIGTGWSNDVPSFPPKDVMDNLEAYLDGQPFKEMVPYYRGFRGTIIKVSNQKYRVTGVYRRASPTTIEVTEIPVGTNKCKSFMGYKNFVESLIIDETEKDEKKKAIQILDDVDCFIENTIIKCVLHFPSSDILTRMMSDIDQFEKTFKLSVTMNTSNMNLFNADGNMTKYDSPEAIMKEYCDHRLNFYTERKNFMVEDITSDILKANEKIRFITYINDDSHPLKVQKRNRAQVSQLLDEYQFAKFARKSSKKKFNPNAEDESADTDEADDNEGEAIVSGPKTSYDYLLNMTISCLTIEMIEKLMKERDRLIEDLASLQATTIQQMWRADLSEFKNKSVDYDVLKLPKGIPRLPNHLKTKILMKPGTLPPIKLGPKIILKTKNSNANESALTSPTVSPTSKLTLPLKIPLKPKLTLTN